MLLSAKTACLNGIETKIMLSFTTLQYLSGLSLPDSVPPDDLSREPRPYSCSSTPWRATP
jgi:hypothetical protein